MHGDRWGTQELGDTGSLSGFGGSLSGGACTGGGGGEAAFVLTACGCAMLRRTAAPTGTEQQGAWSGRRRPHGRCCALRPSSSRRSAILQRCDAAAGLAAARQAEAGRGAVTCSSGVLDSHTAVTHSFLG